jgi:hypothetical protein
MKRLYVSAAFCAAMTFAFLLLYPKSALARPCQSQEYLYFANDQCDGVIGEYFFLCDGSHTSWGDSSPYYAVYFYCCGNPGCEDCGGEGNPIICYYTPHNESCDTLLYGCATN